ncbi:MAG: SpoIIE family protein phosphatase [Bacteroidales bacterium]
MIYFSGRSLPTKMKSAIFKDRWERFEKRLNRYRIVLAFIVLIFSLLYSVFYSKILLNSFSIYLFVSGAVLLALSLYIHYQLNKNINLINLRYFAVSVDLLFILSIAIMVLNIPEGIVFSKTEILFVFSFLLLGVNFLSIFRLTKDVVFYSGTLALAGNLILYFIAGEQIFSTIATTAFIGIFTVFNLRLNFYLRGYWSMKANLKKAYNDIQMANKSIQQKAEEITAQTEQIHKNMENLETFQKDYTDSLIYAQKIQKALIENNIYLKDYFNDFFIYFRPKGFVTGDFYWVSKVEGKLILAVADCTGHGVPGAFMTILGYSLLNEIVNKEGITEPDEILDELRANIIENLHQEGKMYEQKDGMDVAVLQLDSKANKIKFSGANNSLCYVPNHKNIEEKKIFEFKGDRMPASFHYKMRNFSLLEFNISKGDRFYMYTDGYIDQFGGETGKKFKSVTFRRLLLKNHLLPMFEQKEHLERTFNDWLRDVYEQIDDVTVVGLEV